jgi:hypothetical protein
MNKSLIILLFLPFTFVFAQDVDFREQRKGKLFFSVGTEYRITPLPTNKVGDIPENQTNSDIQNSGAAIYYGLNFYATENLSIGFSHSFRYTLLNYNTDIDENFGQKKADNALMLGYHFYLDYHVKVFKEAELFARIGISLINRNSDYTYKETVFDNDGNIIGNWNSHTNYNMQPKNFAIGFKKNKFEAMIGMYATNDPPYFTESVMYMIPYINLNYTIGKLF